MTFESPIKLVTKIKQILLMTKRFIDTAITTCWEIDDRSSREWNRENFLLSISFVVFTHLEITLHFATAQKQQQQQVTGAYTKVWNSTSLIDYFRINQRQSSE